jgi:deoxyribodipyrimidine photo-lyase
MPSTAKPVIVWFRQDLRLADNAALHAAASTGAAVVPVFVLDEAGAGLWKPGGASRWWLHGSLAALDASLRAIGSRLVLRRGSVVAALTMLAEQTGASGIYCSQLFDPTSRRDEEELERPLKARGAMLHRCPGNLLFPSYEIKTRSGEPYQVFTPFWRACTELPEPREPLAAPARLRPVEQWPKSDDLADWHLLPRPDWAKGLKATWEPGETGARRRLHAFVDEGLADYATQRDRPDRDGTSGLSPHLHFGEISPAQCWHAAASVGGRGTTAFRRELGWREFSTYLLYHWPDLPEHPFRRELADFPWRSDKSALRAWHKGQTGYPIVDAGMRQLWETGWMHNRVRMIVASFLVKDLLVPWQDGEAWFWDTLVDADLANNAQGWQWVAGTGADAAPYFRIFNPVTQGRIHDPDGAYVRRYVPELAKLPARHIHAPWEAPATELAAAGVRLGTDYPLPLVHHAAARRRALEAYATVQKGSPGAAQSASGKRRKA